MIRRSLTTKQRASLYAEEVQKAIDANRGSRPICNVCDQPIYPPSKWHESHNKYLPRALGGNVDGIAHERCNLKHAWRHDIPLIAKLKRQEQKRADIFRPRNPMPGGKDSDRYRKVDGTVVMRATGERA